MTKTDSLQFLFEKGTVPKELEGFYKGKLDELIPANLLEYVGKFISFFWLPWRGKTFHKNHGENILPFNKHVFPFKTKITTGLQDPIQVLQLDYNLPENPRKIRKVIDELVCIDKNQYLGKAYIKEKNDIRLIAFFSLKK